MLDGLLGRGFAAKCKSLIKLTKDRIDVIRRKRKATEKFLKKDIADLLANGLDVNAYGRAEGLFAELTLSSCYDFVEQSCDFVLKHLSVLQKLSGCPEEAREAISSLMFAAAGFYDLPELRDLRQIFQDRYGSSLECYVNQEFATNLNAKSSTLEKKVQLMQDIASEFSIRWDSQAFELRMSKSSVLAQDHSNFKSNHMTDHDIPLQGKNATPKEVKYEVLFERSHDHPNDGLKFQNGKEAVGSKGDENYLRSKSKLPIPDSGFKPLSSYDEVNLKRDSHGNPLPGREELTSKMSDRGYWKEGSMLKPIGCSSKDTREKQFEGGSNLHDSWGNARRVKESQDTAAARKSPGHARSHSKNNMNEPYVVNLGGLPDVDNSERKTQKDETPRVKPFYDNAIPHPYIREEQFEGGSNQHNSWGNARRVKENWDTATARKSPGHAGSHSKNNVNEPFVVNHGDLPDVDNSHRRTQKDETPRVKPFFNNALPPPYVKPNPKLKNSTHGTNSVSSNIDSDGIPTYPLLHEKPDATPTMDRIQSGLDDSERDFQAIRHARLSKSGHEKELSIQEDAAEVIVLKQKSMRRKHSKSRSAHNEASNEDAEVVRKPRSRRQDEPKQGLQILFDDERHKNDEEERIIDRLLIHYSKKPSISVPEKPRRKSRSRHAHQIDNSTRESLKSGTREGPDETPEMVTRPPRSVSLPHEQTEAVEVKKVYARAASFQPDRSNEAPHVHPKLPDYDDLAARIAALRGT
ncbi:IST protein [Spatholobus suberectus]|nr:IST protein [Spatholobus suberectus]